MDKTYFSLGDVARLCRTTATRVQYMLASGQIAEPRLRIGNRRIWTIEEIVPISERLGLDKGVELRRKEGDFNA
jgi:hypothetical protein